MSLHARSNGNDVGMDGRAHFLFPCPQLCAPRVNTAGWRLSDLDVLFKCADRERLRAAGDPLPPCGCFTLYRGVAGVKRRRREAGYSWTRSPERAAWFAMRFHLGDPALLVTNVNAEDVLAYLGDEKERGEELFCARPAGGASSRCRAKSARVNNRQIERAGCGPDQQALGSPPAVLTAFGSRCNRYASITWGASASNTTLCASHPSRIGSGSQPKYAGVVGGCRPMCSRSLALPTRMHP